MIAATRNPTHEIVDADFLRSLASQGRVRGLQPGSGIRLRLERYDELIGERVPVVWSRKQRELLRFRMRQAAREVRRVIHIWNLGEFGGGKTMVTAAEFLLGCLLNPYDPRVHTPESPPASGIWAPTLTDLKRGPLAEFKKLCPPELIRRNREGLAENRHILLENGHVIWLYTAEGAANGPNLTQVWADEIQERCYASKWLNIKSRVRDLRSKFLAALASGIAERGHVETFFRGKTVDKDGIYFGRMLYPEDNAANLPEGYADEIRSLSAGSRERDEEGWLMPLGARFPKFSQMANVVAAGRLWPNRFDLGRRLPVSLGLDFGLRAVVVFTVPVTVSVTRGSLPARDELALLVIDQVIAEDCGATELALLARRQVDKHEWNVERGVSKICSDPKAVREQLDPFRTEFPGVDIIQVKEGPYAREEMRNLALDRAIRDQHGNVRLFVHPDLNAKHERGVPESLQGWKADKPKDKFFEDACDATGYVTQHFLRLPRRPMPTRGVQLGSPELERNALMRDAMEEIEHERFA